MTTEERIAQIAQGFGQGIQNFQAAQEMQRARQLQDEARLRQEALQALEVSNTLGQQYGRVVDPAAIQPYLRSGDLTGLSEVLQLQPMREVKQAPIDPLKELELKQRQAQLDEMNKPFSQSREAQKMAFAAGLSKKEQAAQGSQGGMPKLGAEEKKAVGGIASGLRSLKLMEDALNKGYGPRYIDPDTPLVGSFVSDDPFTKEQRLLTDVVGRLQSGGAINNDEGERFKAMGPRPGDSDQIKRQKLKDQKVFLENKLLAMGVSGDQLGQMGFDVGQNIQAAPGQTGARITAKTGINYNAPNIPAPQPFNNAMAADPEQAIRTIKSMTPEQKIEYARKRGLIP